MRLHQSPPGRRLELAPSPYLLRLSDRRKTNPLCPSQSDVNLLGNGKRIVDLDSAEHQRVEPNASNPLADEPAVVARWHALPCAPPPDKQELAGLLAREADVIADRLPGLLGHLETNGTT